MTDSIHTLHISLATKISSFQEFEHPLPCTSEITKERMLELGRLVSHEVTKRMCCLALLAHTPPLQMWRMHVNLTFITNASHI